MQCACAKSTQLFYFTQKVGLVSRALSLSASLEFRSRQRGPHVVRSPVNKLFLTQGDAEHFEALEEFINQDGSQGQGSGLHLQRKTEALISRQLQQQQRKVKKKMLERKVFKQPQEINLLTWNAKQQIRYLNEEFPDEWTAEQLAESFPVSLEGVKQLLKNSYMPRSEQEIAKHDRRVVDHWRQLKEILALQVGPVEERQASQFQHIIEAGKLPLMINAGGCSQLPVPRTARKGRAQRQKQMGLFESIVAGSQVVKAQEVVTKQIGGQTGAEAKDRLLKEIAEFQKGKRKAIPAHFPDQSRNQR
ncbi:uncharacterized protein LOC143281929 [Babylonia areolata]|uniref:uncharacterized protein LOC143281929 n=1 Tax=Babylonia areolata TaxID=304850 RepID=UPI003FD0465A